MKHVNLISIAGIKQFCGALLLTMTEGLPNVYAVESSDTLPVHGKGAPTVPTISVFGFILNRSITVEVGESTDPDGDPIIYEVRWCTQANRGGTCVTGATQSLSTNATRYVSIRAVTARGFPATTQGQSDWGPEVTSVNGDLINIDGLGMFLKPDTTGRTWSDAYQSCIDMVHGGYSDWRLPTEPEVRALYNVYGYNSAGPRFGWPTGGIFYWTVSDSVPVTAGWHRYFGFLDGAVGNSLDGYARYRTCIR